MNTNHIYVYFLITVPLKTIFPFILIPGEAKYTFTVLSVAWIWCTDGGATQTFGDRQPEEAYNL
jgi:hypothetical protein